jgi:hypothetical protein
MQKAVDELLEDRVLAGFIPVVSLTNYYFFWNLSANAVEQGETELAVNSLLQAKEFLADARKFGELEHNKGVLKVVAAEEPDLFSKLRELGLD